MGRLLRHHRVARDDDGAIFAEYAFVLVAVAMVALVAAQLFGTRLLGLFTTIIAAL
jgi:Flp pilus assembly pilin Flp